MNFGHNLSGFVFVFLFLFFLDRQNDNSNWKFIYLSERVGVRTSIITFDKTILIFQFELEFVDLLFLIEQTINLVLKPSHSCQIDS